MGNSYDIRDWIDKRIKPEQINKYISKGNGFINIQKINAKLSEKKSSDPKKIKDILSKSIEIKTLSLEETACLLNVQDESLIDQMRQAALKVKKKVYDNRIVTFAPLYLGNFCVNDCLYCGFRKSNLEAQRKVLNMDEVGKETEVLAGRIGHKRLIAVYGEHPLNDIDYILKSLGQIYKVKVPARKGFGQIRRVNVNAPVFSIEELKGLKAAGIGTYQVFQETYHEPTYSKIHPQGTIKSDYLWRLYCMHRAFEAGIDDVGLGVLFGLYDWKYEVMSLCAHNIELEEKFSIGAHTISFPRLEPAQNSPFTAKSGFKVEDEDFKKIMLVIRLSLPHSGMIITARESASMRRDSLALGITQTDASTRIGIGAYSEQDCSQDIGRQQFILGDTRSLDEIIREFSQLGYITSFCTAGYRCGRTGKCIMDLLRSGQEGKFCKLNAVLTFREWLDDFASEETKKAGEIIIKKELAEIENKLPEFYPKLVEYYKKISEGGRDLYF
ncbi:MAG: [FeFe] hydrogenase H-cluster radical SAM maturase HydG [Candidatus Omnitrophica bacterium]|nr:[FeFe] hydrogenase H-cluster radical SAM maturase HydG [Candidatus Omnitrophota bacterium]MDD5429099.1 [FeFe] hydrogenase H-cluster radical SAM maturase HydG [Candidatus Omnitrophota bacterium]